MWFVGSSLVKMEISLVARGHPPRVDLWELVVPFWLIAVTTFRDGSTDSGVLLVAAIIYIVQVCLSVCITARVWCVYKVCTHCELFVIKIK